MRKLKIAATLCLSFIAAQANAAPSNHHQFGLGVVFGEPSGLTVKYRMDQDEAIDGGLAYSFDNFMLIYADYLYHFRAAFGHSSPFISQLEPYVGIGGSFFINTRPGSRKLYDGNSSIAVGIRIPIGIEWVAAHKPFGVFLELVPGLGIAPGTFGFFGGGVGARYYFY